MLALGGLLALLYGTWQAMRGAFGLPDAATTMTGERLRRWESEQAQAGAKALRHVRAGALIGITLLIATAGATFLAAPNTAGQPCLSTRVAQLTAASWEKAPPRAPPP
jgi:hypothetical protein